MILTKVANKITILMGLTIMQASKNFRSNRLLRIFGRPKWYFEEFCELHEYLGMSGYSMSARIICRGIQVRKNIKAVSSKDYRNYDEYFGVSCNNKTNWG